MWNSSYNRDIDTIVIYTQHGPEVTREQIEKDLIKNVINVVVPKELLDVNTRYFINPTGRFVIGGPQGDSGLTGRKIIVDDDAGELKQLCYAKPVTIGNDCWFGANVVVCPGVKIGDNCVIGAGSVMIKDIPSNSFAAENLFGII